MATKSEHYKQILKYWNSRAGIPFVNKSRVTREILKIIQKTKCRNILEIGCGLANDTIAKETGLSIKVECPISIFEYVIETPNEIRDTTKITFLGYSTNPEEEVKINPEEHQTARWFTKKELLSLHNITEDTRRSAIEALVLVKKQS